MGAVRHLTRWIDPVFPLRRVWNAPREYLQFGRDLTRYRTLPGAEPRTRRELRPRLFERTPRTEFDTHYLYQASWASSHVLTQRPDTHVDIGSDLLWIASVAPEVPITFVDVRPPELPIDNVTSVEGSLIDLPFEDDSVRSLSCLHVVEHVGLGRYGDPLDPKGTERAARELVRVLAPGGTLLFSVPVGRERVVFNSHRILAPATVRRYFHALELVEHAGVDDNGTFRRRRDPDELATESYACGMYRFTKPA